MATVFSCALAASSFGAQEKVVLHGAIVPLSPNVAATATPVSDEHTGDLMPFCVPLQMRNLAELQQRVSRGEVIPMAEMQQKYLPLPSDYATVMDWLKGEGFAITYDDPNRLTIFAKGTLSQIQASLSVQMAHVTVDGTEYNAATNAPAVPAPVANVIVGVNGLQPYRKFRSHLRRPAAQQRPDGSVITNAGFTPAGNIVAPVAASYDAVPATIGYNGAGQKIAILIDAAPQLADLTGFWTFNNIPQTTSNIEIINTSGGGLPSPEGEETLDVQWSSSMAPGAKVRVYAVGSLSDFAIEQGLTTLINDLPTQPALHQFSMSFGLGEIESSAADIQAETQDFAVIASQGVTIFCSTGDNGSNPNYSGGTVTSDGPLEVNYPASDPSITAVGGTILTINQNVASEIGWFGSGGGISRDFARQGWQTGTGVLAGTKRLIPDVSALGYNDPNQPYLYVYLKKTWEEAYGTSFSSPIWAGMCALINQAVMSQPNGQPIGPLNPRIYGLIGTVAFHDVTSGSNGAYTAHVGHDLVTGIGSPDIGQLINAATSSGTPTVTTGTATDVTGTSATLSGTVNANGGQTNVIFEYGTTTGYGKSVTAVESPVAGSTDTPVTGLLTGLVGHVTYHFRVTGTTFSGPVSGLDATFDTPNNPPVVHPFTLFCNGSSATGDPRTKDTDIDGDTLEITGATDGTFGTVTYTKGNVTYKPGPQYAGSDSFDYTVDDKHGGVVTGTVTVMSSSTLILNAQRAGTQVPGADPGTVFQTFSYPQAGTFSGLYLSGKIRTNAIFAPSGEIVLKVGDTVPGGSGAKITKFGSLSGDAAVATLSPVPKRITAKNNTVLLTGLESNAPAVAVQTGTSYPGLPDGVTIKKFLSVDGNGADIFFLANLQGKGITAKNNLALCSTGKSGLFNVLAMTNQTVGSDTISVLATLVGSAGTLAEARWRVDDSTVGVRLTLSNKTSVLYEIPATAASQADWILVQSSGVPLTGALNGTEISSFGLPGFGPSSSSSIAYLTGTGVTKANGTAILSFNGGTAFPLARLGGTAVDPAGHGLIGASYKSFHDPIEGANGSLAFMGTMAGRLVNGGNNSAIWYSPDGVNLKMVARTGDAAGDLGHWAKFNSLILGGQSGATPIFSGTLRISGVDGVNAANNSGLWVLNPSGRIQTLLRTKQPVPVGGVARFLTKLTVLAPVPGTLGAGTGYDASGNISVIANFSDKTTWIFQVLVP